MQAAEAMPVEMGAALQTEMLPVGAGVAEVTGQVAVVEV
jgi:hypothetical protein